MSVSRDNTDLLLAHARTGMICYDYSAKKVVAIPEKLKEILQS
jgi:acyl-CoA thioesterase FadM